ncbi:hypothetical protein CLV55_11334 [Flavobacterium aciduliphilum]|uniref:Uncharacterized protein n=1 Tax=Flavobacterium aciduliphilum TaxID=1101402 RepID=A0A328YBZ2_9FLAO|nr:hypothetical protein CLV55_11334 [Flavobacterium aciduliphilum]
MLIFKKYLKKNLIISKYLIYLKKNICILLKSKKNHHNFVLEFKISLFLFKINLSIK